MTAEYLCAQPNDAQDISRLTLHRGLRACWTEENVTQCLFRLRLPLDAILTDSSRHGLPRGSTTVAGRPWQDDPEQSATPPRDPSTETANPILALHNDI